MTIRKLVFHIFIILALGLIITEVSNNLSQMKIDNKNKNESKTQYNLNQKDSLKLIKNDSIWDNTEFIN